MELFGTFLLFFSFFFLLKNATVALSLSFNTRVNFRVTYFGIGLENLKLGRLLQTINPEQRVSPSR